MANRVNEVGAIHRVEMEMGDASVDQVDHLLGGDRGGDQLARGRIVIEAVEALGQPTPALVAPARAAKFFAALKFCTGRMPGTIGI